jgi:DNA-binding LytR/AlgR family response regulator
MQDPEIKIRLMISPEKYGEVAAALKSRGITLDDSAELILTEKSAYPAFIIGKKGEELFRLPVGEISHIESFAHEVVAHTAEGDMRLGDRLVRLEQLLDPAEFVRVSKSVIVSLSHVKSIRPALTQKFILTMKDGSRVDVTRSYYYIFREAIGLP